MARVWRDGQTKKVFVYRLVTTASVEEKVRVDSTSVTFCSPTEASGLCSNFPD
jgi:hypothetical protein